MQITYTVKKWDILVSRLSFTIFNRGLLILSIVLIFALAWIMMPGSQFTTVSTPVRIFAALFALIFSTVVYGFFLIVVNFLHVLCSRNSGIEGRHLMEIKDEGLEESTDIDKSLHRWNSAFRVREFGNHVLIFPTESKVFVIPKRRGACEGDLPAFCRMLKSKAIGK